MADRQSTRKGGPTRMSTMAMRTRKMSRAASKKPASWSLSSMDAVQQEAQDEDLNEELNEVQLARLQVDGDGNGNDLNFGYLLQPRSAFATSLEGESPWTCGFDALNEESAWAREVGTRAPVTLHEGPPGSGEAEKVAEAFTLDASAVHNVYNYDADTGVFHFKLVEQPLVEAEEDTGPGKPQAGTTVPIGRDQDPSVLKDIQTRSNSNRKQTPGTEEKDVELLPPRVAEATFKIAADPVESRAGRLSKTPSAAKWQSISANGLRSSGWGVAHDFSYIQEPMQRWGVNWGSTVLVSFSTRSKPQLLYLPGERTYDPSAASTLGGPDVRIPHRTAQLMVATMLAQIKAIHLGADADDIKKIQRAAEELLAVHHNRRCLYRWLGQQILSVVLNTTPATWPEFMEQEVQRNLLNLEASAHIHSRKYLQQQVIGQGLVPPIEFFDAIFNHDMHQLYASEQEAVFQAVSRDRLASYAELEVRRTRRARMPALHIACLLRKREEIRERVEIHGELDARSPSGDSCLHTLARLLMFADSNWDDERVHRHYIVVPRLDRNRIDVWNEHANIALELLGRNIDVHARNQDGVTASDCIDALAFLRGISPHMQRMLSADSDFMVYTLARIHCMASAYPVIACLKLSQRFKHHARERYGDFDMLKFADTFSAMAAELVALKLGLENRFTREWDDVVRPIMGSDRAAAYQALQRSDSGAIALRVAVRAEDVLFLTSPHIRPVLEKIWIGQHKTYHHENPMKSVDHDQEERHSLRRQLAYVYHRCMDSIAIPKVRLYLYITSELTLLAFFTFLSIFEVCEEINMQRIACYVSCDRDKASVTAQEAIAVVFFVGKLVEEHSIFRMFKYNFKHYTEDVSTRLFCVFMPFAMLVLITRQVVLREGDFFDRAHRVRESTPYRPIPPGTLQPSYAPTGSLAPTGLDHECTKELDFHPIFVLFFITCQMFTFIIMWLRSLYLFSAQRHLGPELRIMGMMCRDVGRFSLMMCLCITGFSFGLVCFFSVEEKEDSMSFLLYFKATARFMFSSFLGDFDATVFYTDKLQETPVKLYAVIVFYIAFLLVSNIMLLNLLIAMMSASYDVISANERTQHLVDRARIIMRYDQIRLRLPTPLNLCDYAVYMLVLPLASCGFCRHPPGEWLCASCLIKQNGIATDFCVQCGNFNTRLEGRRRLRAEVAVFSFRAFVFCVVTLVGTPLVIMRLIPVFLSCLARCIFKLMKAAVPKRFLEGGKDRLLSLRQIMSERSKKSVARSLEDQGQTVQAAMHYENSRSNRQQIFDLIKNDE